MPAKLQWVLWAGVTNPRHQVIWATKFFIVVLNTGESPIRSMLHVTLPASRTFMWGPGFVENLWTPNLRCCLSVCEVKKLNSLGTNLRKTAHFESVQCDVLNALQ